MPTLLKTMSRLLARFPPNTALHTEANKAAILDMAEALLNFETLKSGQVFWKFPGEHDFGCDKDAY